MYAVILAAGRSTRTYPLTLTRPKALLPVANRPILEWNLLSLSGLVDRAVIVVGYMKDMIMERFGSSFEGIKIEYAEQGEQLGTAHALLSAENFVSGRFLVMMGDDLYERSLLEECLRQELCVAAEKVENPSAFGVWVEKDGMVSGFAEKPKQFVSDLANTGLYNLDNRIFDEIRKLEKTERGEYELNEAVNSLASSGDVLIMHSRGRWRPVGYPWDVLNANEWLLERIEFGVEGEIEDGTVLKGNVSVGKGTLVKSGAYIEGPAVIGENSVIGPNCYIRGSTSIGSGCRVGNGVEIKNSVIMDGAKVNHLSYIGDSVIGCGVNIGGGTLTANLRHDGKNIMCFVKGEKLDTGRRKFGAVIGDGAKTGISTVFYPGRKMWPGKTTLPGEIVKNDIE